MLTNYRCMRLPSLGEDLSTYRSLSLYLFIYLSICMPLALVLSRLSYVHTLAYLRHEFVNIPFPISLSIFFSLHVFLQLSIYFSRSLQTKLGAQACLHQAGSCEHIVLYIFISFSSFRFLSLVLARLSQVHTLRFPHQSLFLYVWRPQRTIQKYIEQELKMQAIPQQIVAEPSLDIEINMQNEKERVLSRETDRQRDLNKSSPSLAQTQGDIERNKKKQSRHQATHSKQQAAAGGSRRQQAAAGGSRRQQHSHVVIYRCRLLFNLF